MLSHTGNLEKSLELVQKTYNVQSTTTTNNNNENKSRSRSSIVKLLTHQSSRKNSVHDIHQLMKDDLNKILIDIQENLSHLTLLLETMKSIENIPEEFFKLKDLLFKLILDFISKSINQSGRRSSIASKGNLINIPPQELIYSIEYFRSELVKSLYLFNSFTFSSSFYSIDLNTRNVNTISNANIEQIRSNERNLTNLEDINQIKKDIYNLEEHIYILNQRYYSQIPDCHSLDQTLRERITTDGSLTNSHGLNLHRVQFQRFNRKFSRRSSVGSNEHLTFYSRLCQKCHFICCICTHNYI